MRRWLERGYEEVCSYRSEGGHVDYARCDQVSHTGPLQVQLNQTKRAMVQARFADLGATAGPHTIQPNNQQA